MKDREVTVRARTLASRLRWAMETKGWSVTRLGEAMGWSPSKASRFLSCKRGADILDIATVLGHLGVRGADRDEILDLATNTYERSWWQERGDRLPGRLPVVNRQEESATTITAFHPTVVPDLFQTAAYSRALLRAGSAIPSGEINKHLALRQHRQTLIDRKDPPLLRVLIDQHALTHSGTDRQTIAQQVHHLLRLSTQPHITIRVLPNNLGMLRGYPPFELLSFDDGQPAVYLEMLNTTGFLEQPTTVATFQRALADLEHAALTAHASRAWLRDLADALDHPHT